VVTNGHTLKEHSFIKVYIAKTFKNRLINHWPMCLDIWYGTSYGQGDSKQLGYFELFHNCHHQMLC